MMIAASILEVDQITGYLLIVFALVLLAILIVSFRSRAVVFCQYLKAMTGIELSPPEVKQVFAARGREGVRELFLDRIIREDLKEGPIEIPGEELEFPAAPEEEPVSPAESQER